MSGVDIIQSVGVLQDFRGCLGLFSDIYDPLSHDCEESRGRFFGETTETKTPKTTTQRGSFSGGRANKTRLIFPDA